MKLFTIELSARIREPDAAHTQARQWTSANIYVAVEADSKEAALRDLAGALHVLAAEHQSRWEKRWSNELKHCEPRPIE